MHPAWAGFWEAWFPGDPGIGIRVCAAVQPGGGGQPGQGQKTSGSLHPPCQLQAGRGSLGTAQEAGPRVELVLRDQKHFPTPRLAPATEILSRNYKTRRRVVHIT